MKTTEKGKTLEVEGRQDTKKKRLKSKRTEKEDWSYYVVSESLPLLLFEGLTEAVDEFVQLLGVAAQELPDLLQALQTVWGRWAELTRARLHLDGPGDAQDAVALLLVIVEGFIKQDGDRRRSRKAGSQQDLPVLDPDLLQHMTRPTPLVNSCVPVYLLQRLVILCLPFCRQMLVCLSILSLDFSSKHIGSYWRLILVFKGGSGDL